MKKSTLHYIIILIVLAGCANTDNNFQSRDYVRNRAASSFENSHKTVVVNINIIPYGNFPPELSTYIYDRFIKIYPHAKLLNPIPLPTSAFYQARNRYRADSLIKQLSARTPVNHVTLGLTVKDISYTKNQYSDFGIFGLSYMPGKACVASFYRLKNNKETLFKVAIHELGHTQGLDHCPNETCIMRDYNGKDISNKLTGFCPACKTKLTDAGWIFK